MPEKTALYRLYNADGDLLYIGITSKPKARWKQHAADKPWWSEVAVREFDWRDSRKAAEQAEEQAIHAERPRYNVLHQVRPDVGNVNRVDALTAAQVLALPALVPLWPSVGAALGGMSRPATYAAANDGTLPVPVIRIGRLIKVRRSDLISFLGLAEEMATAPGSSPTPPAEHAPRSTASQQ